MKNLDIIVKNLFQSGRKLMGTDVLLHNNQIDNSDAQQGILKVGIL
jgi:hypothetical protein